MRSMRMILPALALWALASCGGNDGGGEHVLKIQKWPPSGDLQTDTVGLALPKDLRVKVTLDGVVVGGYMVHFTGGELSNDSIVTDASGIATSTWTLSGDVGTQIVTVTLPGAEGSPLTFSATAVPGAPAHVAAFSGNQQIVGKNKDFSAPMVTKISDQFGNGVQGVWVYFSDSGNVNLGADSIITNAQGLVSLNVHANDSTGIAHVVATVAGVPGSPLGFTATVVDTVVNVDLAGTTYTPSTVSIPHGSAVRWTWVQGSHSVSPDSTTFFDGTGAMNPPTVYGPLIFTTPGTYGIHCTVQAGMTGTISVY